MAVINRMSVAILLGCWCLNSGCAQQAPTTGGKAVPAASAASNNDVGAAKAEDVDWTVPRLPPKPLIWIDEWKGEPESSPERVNAEAVVRIADGLKATQQYSDAAGGYSKAIATDPTWPYPVYQAACNFELWGQHELAVAEFKKALELGFSDFPTMLGDGELGQIRERPEFPSQLRKVRDLYLTQASKLVGQPIAVRPRESQPPTGWPVMLLLHGYGDTNLSYLGQAVQWAGQGYLTVAVPGSVPAGDGHYQWSHQSTAATQEDLQAILNSPILKGVADPGQVYLLGFSQGALHGLMLTAENPQQYAGVVALSPGGSFADRLATPHLNRSQRTAKIYFIHGDTEPHAPFVKIWEQACKDAQWRFHGGTHPGGHHFPLNWDDLLPEVARFLKS